MVGSVNDTFSAISGAPAPTQCSASGKIRATCGPVNGFYGIHRHLFPCFLRKGQKGPGKRNLGADAGPLLVRNIPANPGAVRLMRSDLGCMSARDEDSESTQDFARVSSGLQPAAEGRHTLPTPLAAEMPDLFCRFSTLQLQATYLHRHMRNSARRSRRIVSQAEGPITGCRGDRKGQQSHE
jgi:hypothetical protein